ARCRGAMSRMPHVRVRAIRDRDERAGTRMLTKYVFIQNDPFYLPKVLDKFLREFADSTVGVNIQSVAQGKRTVFQTALDLYRMYGFRYFQYKLRGYLWRKVMGKIENDLLGSTRRCWSVRAVARKYGVEVTE